MSESITFRTNYFLALVDSMLRTEDGVSHHTYEKLYSLCVYEGHHQLWLKISEYVEATDNRFYLKEDAPNLANLTIS